MERQNCVNRQFSKENSVSKIVCVNGTRSVHEICDDSCYKISYSHDLSSKRSEPEECVPAYQCDKPSGYNFVDVGNDLIESGYFLEEDDDICKVSSETLFTDSKDIDYNLVKNVNIERCLKNSSKENEMNNHNSATTVFNNSDICTEDDRSGLSTNACMENVCENLDDCDKKPSIDVDYTTSAVGSVCRGFEKVNVKEEKIIDDDYITSAVGSVCRGFEEVNVKEEKIIDDVLVHQSTENVNPEIKREEMVYNEDISVLDEPIIDIKFHEVNKVEEPSDINTNVSCVLDESSKAGFIVLSKTVNSDLQEIHSEYSEKVPDNCHIGSVMVPKPLKDNEAVQSKRESHLKLQNKVQTLSRACSELQINPQTNSGDDTGADGLEDKFNEEDVNTEAKNKNDAPPTPYIYDHHGNEKSKQITVRHYVCPGCYKDFTQLCDFIAHKCTHSDDRPLASSTCPEAFTRPSHLNTEKHIHIADRPFVCDACGKTFTQRANLKQHKRIHTGDRPFSCSICGKVFTILTNLKAHKRIHTGERPFGCTTCGKAFTLLGNLNAHKRIHTGDSTFACSTCGKTFTQLSNLKHHKRIHTGERLFGCNTCGKAFTQNSDLKKHKRIHTGEKPFACSTCGKAFALRGNLKSHKCIHTGDSTFGCSTCGKTFTQLTNLKRHKCIQTVSKLFCCNICGESFTHDSDLKTHKQVHTGEKPFGCSTCGKAFTLLGNLKAHNRIHTGDRPFGCDICGKAFRWVGNLKAHKRLHNGDGPFGFSV